METTPSPNEVPVPVYVGETLVFMTPPEYYAYLASLFVKCSLDNNLFM